MDKNPSINQSLFLIEPLVIAKEKNNDNHFFLTKDKSLMYSSKICGDYSVLLGGNWRFELIVDSSTGLCIKFQSFLDELHIIRASLTLPQSIYRNIYFTSSDSLSPSCGCYYTPFEDVAYWDPKRHLLCIGNPHCNGEAIEFTNKSIAVINNGKLECVYLVLDNITLDFFL